MTSATGGGASPPRRVSLFVTCLIDQFYPEVGESVVNVLERLGVEVDFPREQTCCGQPAFSTGYFSDAQPVARRFLELFDGDDPIVVPSGSCGAMVRNFYKELFHDDLAAQEKAARVGGRLYEFSEFIVDVLGRTDLGGSLPTTATYHRCCHLLRELGVDHQPEALLRGVDGLELREMEQSEVCCGFGGTFSVKFADISTAMLNDKLGFADATGADLLVAGDAGCLMHMEGGLRRRDTGLKAIHIAELLDRATSGAGAGIGS